MGDDTVSSAAASNNFIKLLGTTGQYRTIALRDSNSTLSFDNGSNIAHLTATGIWTDASDIAIKKDISPISYGLDTIMKMQPRSYKMKSDDSPQIGFVAQELEQVIPEVVSGEEGAKGIAYGHITAVLVKAVQEQQKQIEGLKQELVQLKEKM